jgi:hypothetical protein
VLLFLSYANEDSEIAREIVDRLASKDVSVHPARDAARFQELAAGEPEAAIEQADAFLALLSPDSLTSTSCRREREIALDREELDAGDSFVQVLQVRETPYHRAGALRRKPWLDLTGDAARDFVLNDLADRLGPPAGPPPDDHPAHGGNGGHRRRHNPDFRNRERELEEINAGLVDQDGEHFWLVIAPPQLGKTWLLERIGAEYDQHAMWRVKFVDVRELPPEVAADPDAILRMMYGDASSSVAGQSVAAAIATSLISSHRYHLCLLDSAELLDDRVIRGLRRALNRISRGIAEANSPNVRCALVAASRRDNEWKGITPAPRIQIRRLTEFKAEVIQAVLAELPGGRNLSSSELHELAVRMHTLSEGLPALLAGFLDWIRERHFQDRDRLAEHETFDQIARPYIDRELFSPASMRGAGDLPTPGQQAAIRKAFLALSPYRFLTESHLDDGAAEPSRVPSTVEGHLLAGIEDLGWSVEDLWAEISTTDLLYRPMREPWQEVYVPIRRLLFRHTFPSAAEGCQAHRVACLFMRSYMARQYGSDRCRVFVECLWHKAQELLLGSSPVVEDALVSFARELDEELRPPEVPTPGFDRPQLRDIAAWNLRNDQEFEETLAAFPDLFERLIEAIRQPG